MKQKFAIQLHTLRKEFEQDFAGVLRELAAMGWAGVQTAQFETSIDGASALTYLLDTTDGSNIYAEPDVYWVKKSGNDPLTFIKQYPNRIPYIHLKDMTHEDNAEFTEIGTGIIDFKPIFE